MVSIRHELMLEDAITVLKSKGYRVIRLDKRTQPDAVAISENEVISVEVETGRGATPNNTSPPEGFDHTIMIQRGLSSKYHTTQEYKEALVLRKEGLTYDEIKRRLEQKYGRGFSRDIIHCWVKGKAKPLAFA